MTDKGTCKKHGEFILMEGCLGCLAERRQAGIRPEQDEMENGLNQEGLTLATEPFIIKVQFYSETMEVVGSKPYTYYSEDPLAIGDIVRVPVRGTTTKARVVAIDVPESEIEAFKDRVKTIPSGSVVTDKTIEEMEQKVDAKVNLCDTCSLRNEYPVCSPRDVEFGDGKGNDNIIQCSKYNKGAAETAPELIGEQLAKEAGISEPATEIALVLRPGEDVEVHGYFEEAMKLLDYAEARVIATIEDNKLANDDLALIAKLKRVMENKRKSLLDPLKLQADAIRDTYNYLMTPVLEADKITRGKTLTFDTEQRRIRAEQEEINRKRMEAAEQEMKLNGELSQSVDLVEVAPEPAKSVSTEMGTSGMTDHWKYEVIDFSLLPDAYKVADSAMLNTIAKKHHDNKQIPGVRFYNEPYIAVRAR